MKKSLLALATACSLAFAPAAFASEVQQTQPQPVKAEPAAELAFQAPAPEAARETELASLHEVADEAAQQETAGDMYDAAIPIAILLIVGLVVSAI